MKRFSAPAGRRALALAALVTITAGITAGTAVAHSDPTSPNTVATASSTESSKMMASDCVVAYDHNVAAVSDMVDSGNLAAVSHMVGDGNLAAVSDFAELDVANVVTTKPALVANSEIVLDPIEQCEVPQAEIDRANAEQDALAEYLRARGIDVTVTTNGEWRFVEYDWENPAAQMAVEDYYWALYPTPVEVIEQINADATAMAEFLARRGIAATVVTDRHGLMSVSYDSEDPATQIAIEDYYWELYPTPADVIEQFNADAEALVTFLQDRGFDASVSVDRHGIATATYDWENPAIQVALNDYWSQFQGPGGVIEPAVAFEARG